MDSVSRSRARRRSVGEGSRDLFGADSDLDSLGDSNVLTCGGDGGWWSNSLFSRLTLVRGCGCSLPPLPEVKVLPWNDWTSRGLSLYGEVIRVGSE